MINNITFKNSSNIQHQETKKVSPNSASQAQMQTDILILSTKNKKKKLETLVENIIETLNKNENLARKLSDVIIKANKNHPVDKKSSTETDLRRKLQEDFD